MNKSYIIEGTGQLERLISYLKARDLPIQVDVGPVRRQRTLSQNARLWALHALASRETGYSPEELHELMLCRHYGVKDVTLQGYTMRAPLKRSSPREVKEFAEFMEAVESFYASELGIWLEEKTGDA